MENKLTYEVTSWKLRQIVHALNILDEIDRIAAEDGKRLWGGPLVERGETGEMQKELLYWADRIDAGEELEVDYND